jgi:phasin family protein
MAKNTEQETFVDMFTKFGEQLRVPNVDFDAIVEHHRRNLEALERSAKTANAGASAMIAKQREILQETLREITEMAQSYRSPGNPQELMNKQADFARRSFETAVKNTSEMAELVKNTSDETLDVLRKRIRDGMEEIREGYDKRK